MKQYSLKKLLLFCWVGTKVEHRVKLAEENEGVIRGQISHLSTLLHELIRVWKPVTSFSFQNLILSHHRYH